MDPANQQSNNQESTLKNEKPLLTKELFSWKAPVRSFQKKDRRFYVTTFSIAGMVCLILFLAEGIMPVILIVSLVFLYYVLTTVPPEETEYKITTKGIKMGDNQVDWANLRYFGFINKNNSEILVIGTTSLNQTLQLIISTENKNTIKDILKDYLEEITISPSTLDRAIDWFSKKLPQ